MAEEDISKYRHEMLKANTTYLDRIIMYKSAYGRSTEDNATSRCGNNALRKFEADEEEEYGGDEDREIADGGVLMCNSRIGSENEERRGAALGEGIGVCHIDLGRCGGDE